MQSVWLSCSGPYVPSQRHTPAALLWNLGELLIIASVQSLLALDMYHISLVQLEISFSKTATAKTNKAKSAAGS